MTEPAPERPAEPVAPASPAPRRRLLIYTLAAAVAFGLGAVYGIVGPGGNAQPGGKCAATLDRAAKLKPWAKGDVAAFTPADTRRDLTALAFTGSDGQPTTLAAWKGRVVLLNLWATWCVPCRKEMPALDRLQKAAGSPDFEVVALNLDTRDPERSKRFLADVGVTNLAWRADPTLAAMKGLQQMGLVLGLPTTVLIDREGCELGVMAGPAEWDRSDAAALVAKAVETP